MTDTNGKEPLRVGDLVVNPKIKISIEKIIVAADEQVNLSASGKWTTHPHGGPNWTGPGGDKQVKVGGKFNEGCLLVIVNRGHVPFEIHDFSEDFQRMLIPGPCAVAFGPQDDWKHMDDNENMPRGSNPEDHPMTVHWEIYKN